MYDVLSFFRDQRSVRPYRSSYASGSPDIIRFHTSSTPRPPMRLHIDGRPAPISLSTTSALLALRTGSAGRRNRLSITVLLRFYYRTSAYNDGKRANRRSSTQRANRDCCRLFPVLNDLPCRVVLQNRTRPPASASATGLPGDGQERLRRFYTRPATQTISGPDDTRQRIRGQRSTSIRFHRPEAQRKYDSCRSSGRSEAPRRRRRAVARTTKYAIHRRVQHHARAAILGRVVGRGLRPSRCRRTRAVLCHVDRHRVGCSQQTVPVTETAFALTYNLLDVPMRSRMPNDSSYTHAPDSDFPYSPSMSLFHDAHRQGLFSRRSGDYHCANELPNAADNYVAGVVHEPSHHCSNRRVSQISVTPNAEPAENDDVTNPSRRQLPFRL